MDEVNNFLKNSIVIKEFSEEVKLIQKEEQKFIYKKINLPITFKQELQKKEFVDFLYANNISVARIFKVFQVENGDIYEIQEFIESEKIEKELSEVIEQIARFHKVSSGWQHGDFNEKVYSANEFCCGIKLTKILLGFEEKYYTYPIENYLKNKYLLQPEISNKVNEVVNAFKKFFEYFVAKYDVYSCIGHNDMTSNNYITQKDNISFIDFDFAIHTSEYVDVIDIILKRKLDLKETIKNYKSFKEDISYLIDRYNAINPKLTLEGMLTMLIIKIVSFNIYMNLNETNLNKFMSNIDDIEQLIILINNDLKVYKR